MGVAFGGMLDFGTGRDFKRRLGSRLRRPYLDICLDCVGVAGWPSRGAAAAKLGRPKAARKAPSVSQLRAKLGKSLFDLAGFFGWLSRISVVTALFRTCARGTAAANLQGEVARAIGRAEELSAKAAAKQEKSWHPWVEQSLFGGAGQAHRFH